VLSHIRANFVRPQTDFVSYGYGPTSSKQWGQGCIANKIVIGNSLFLNLKFQSLFSNYIILSFADFFKF